MNEPRPTLRLVPGDTCQGFVTELLLRCGRGEEAALGQIFDLFFPLVRGMVDPRTERADDLVVEAFVHLWRRAPTYHPGRPGAVEWVVAQVSTFLDHHPCIHDAS